MWYSITEVITKTMVIVFHILSPSNKKALRGKFLLVLVLAVFLLSLNVRPERGWFLNVFNIAEGISQNKQKTFYLFHHLLSTYSTQVLY